jgi:deazaflavin-dependent oxidoreductase (nitroreductase family)
MPADHNTGVIEEFRANGGKVGGFYEGATLGILHTIGARTGRPHLNPVDYLPDGDRFVVFATKGGSPTNPDWYHNLRAHSEAELEVGTGGGGVETVRVRAVEIQDEEERRRLYARQVERRPGFAEYPKKTSRRIPILALERID